jgi:hypothetical protein
MANRRAAYNIWWENLRERDHLKDLGVDGKVILKGVFKKWIRTHGLDRSGLGQDGACDRGNTLPSYTKCGNFID